MGVWPKFVEPTERVSKGTRATWKNWPFTTTCLPKLRRRQATVEGTVTRSRPLEICQVTGAKGVHRRHS